MEHIYLSLMAAVLLSLVILLVKYITRYVIADFDSFFFWTYIAVLPLILIIVLREGIVFSWSLFIPMMVHSILLTAGQYMFSKGIYLVDASVISPLFQL